MIYLNNSNLQSRCTGNSVDENFKIEIVLKYKATQTLNQTLSAKPRSRQEMGYWHSWFGKTARQLRLYSRYNSPIGRK